MLFGAKLACPMTRSLLFAAGSFAFTLGCESADTQTPVAGGANATAGGGQAAVANGAGSPAVSAGGPQADGGMAGTEAVPPLAGGGAAAQPSEPTQTGGDGSAVGGSAGGTSGAGAVAGGSGETASDGGSSSGGTPAQAGAAGMSAQAGEGGAEPAVATTPMQQELASLPTVRQEHSAAAVAGKVYVIGGFTPDVTASVQAYDPELDSWSDVADFPEALHHANVAAVGDTIYVLGFNRGGSFTDIDGRVFAYDPVADNWTERASMPTGTERSSSCTGVLGTKIYLFGGSTNTAGNGPSVVDSSVYDTELDSWEVLPPMPEPREHCLAGGVAGVLYIVSGRSNSITGVQVESWAFDPQTNQFEEKAPIPTPRGGTAGAVLGNKIYVFGGEGNSADANGVFHNVEAYDPSSDSWEILPDMLVARHGFAAAAVGDRIYLPGGATSQGFGANNAVTVFFFE